MIAELSKTICDKGCSKGFVCDWQNLCVPEAGSQYISEQDLEQCIADAPLYDESKNVAALNECAQQAGFDVKDKNSCALKCTLEAIGVYWSAAASCIKRQAPNRCITVECPAIVAAFDVPCLKRCHNLDIHL